MSELIVPVATVLIGTVSGITGSYIVIKHSMNTDTLMDKISEITDEISHDEQMMTKIATIAAAAGKGFAMGTGLDQVKGIMKPGKMNLQNIIAQIAMGMLGSKIPALGAITGQQQEQQQQPQSSW